MNEDLETSIAGNVKGVLLTAGLFAREVHMLAREDKSIVGHGWASFEPRMLLAGLDQFSRIIIEPLLKRLSPEYVLAPAWPASTSEYEADGIFVRASIGSDYRDDIVLSVVVERR